MRYKKSKIKKIEVVDYDDYVYDIMLENQKVPYFFANKILTHNSAYPHAMMMNNLYSPEENGWHGDNYYTVEGTYNNKEMGKVEKTIKELFMERLKAKKSKDRLNDQSYKLVINSAYGLTGNWKFKSLYNPTSAADCTHVVRTWMKKLAKTLEENGFECLYGFTDSIFVKVPEESNKEELMMVVNYFIKEALSHCSFPLDTFKMEVEEEIKMIWFVAKNCYLFITKDDMVKYKSTLLNKNTPKVVMVVFEKYIKPKMIKELDVNFNEEELMEEIKKILNKDLNIAAEEYIVGELKDYKVTTSIQYQIAEVYGSGKHLLIPNKSMIGIGKNKGTKKVKPVRYCSIEEFNKNKLTIDDIDLKKLMKHLEPFIKLKKDKIK